MICPNCGAEMEQRAFMNVCSFCGSISVTERTASILSESEKDASQCYEYIKQNLIDIKQNQRVEIKEIHNGFIISSSKPYYLKDIHFNIDKSISFWLYAKVLKTEINISLLISSTLNNDCDYICLKTPDGVLTIKQQGKNIGKFVFPISYEEFCLLCKSKEIFIDTNLLYNKHEYVCNDFVIFCRMFYNIVIDKNKYQYAIYQVIN